jgi:hypothetical protein
MADCDYFLISFFRALVVLLMMKVVALTTHSFNIMTAGVLETTKFWTVALGELHSKLISAATFQ